MRYRCLTALTGAALCLGLAGGAVAQSVSGTLAPADAAPALSLELNKLEDREGSCLAYLVLQNPTDQDYTVFLLDLIVFQTDGIIARRLAIQLAPLLADKTTVKLFEIPEIGCDAIGRVLINAVTGCETPDGEIADCIRRLSLSSRAAAKLEL